MGLPRWFSGQESACQRRGHGLDPGSRKIPCAVEELSLGARTTKAPERLSSAPRCSCSLRQRDRRSSEAPAWPNRVSFIKGTKELI